jgi:calcineurin-like phosphoesterase family protein
MRQHGVFPVDGSRAGVGSLRVAASALTAGVIFIVLAACQPASNGATSGSPDERPSRRAPVVAAAGDISCSGNPCTGQRETADLLTRIDPTAVLTLGDNQYQRGTLADYRSSYDPTWGRFLERTHPVPGNHEYLTPGASGYFAYFGPRAHERPGGGWYSFNIGRWHLVAIDSGLGSVSEEQLAWIKMDLATDDHRCELAFWHHPRWSSGTVHGSEQDLDPLWQLLFAQGVDLVLNGHSHHYERFAPLDPDGREDPGHGIREFIVGTGGGGFHRVGDPEPGSERRIADTFGVLELTLDQDAYTWRFLSADGSVPDDGGGACHP